MKVYALRVHARVQPLLRSVLVAVMFLSSCQVPTSMQSLYSTDPVIPRGGSVALALPDALTIVQPWSVTTRAAEVFVTLSQSGLMRLDRTGSPQLELLDRYEASPAGTVITATLKADLQWSDTTPLTSADVVYTYQTLLAFTPSTPLLSEMRAIERVEATDATTVVFSLSAPYAPLVSVWALPILPMHAVGTQPIETLNLVSLTVGAGPFVFAEKDAAGLYHLRANPLYVRGAPYLDEIIVVPEQSGDDAMRALSAGTVQIAELDRPWGADKPASVTTARVAQNELMGLVFNVRTTQTFADAALRRTMQAATDFPAIIQEMSETTLIPVDTMSIINHPFAASVPISRTNEITSSLITAGWVWDSARTQFVREDEPLVIRLSVDQTNQTATRIGELLAQQWRDLGLSVELTPIDRQAYLNQFIPPFAYDGTLVTWANGRSSSVYADTFLYDGSSVALFDDALINTGMPDIRATLNLTGYGNPQLRALHNRAMRAYDFATRASIEREAVQIALDGASIIPFARPTHTMAWQSTIATPAGVLNLDTPWYLYGVEQWYRTAD
jgi:peptide/nickel transport system substrate-binding protein